MNQSSLPVAVIGAGPIGLAAATHLLVRGETPLVLEAGPTVGASIRAWGHVRVFSPWSYNIDPLAEELLVTSGWTAPDPDAYPTGHELVSHYLEPLAALPQLAPHIRLNTRVGSVTRLGFDKMKTTGREDAPFLLIVQTAGGGETTVLAKAVIDASGTYQTANPLGSSGVPAPGETALADRIFYGIPDVLGTHRSRYSGRRVAVVGSGHSAFNALLDLVTLQEAAPATEITWVVRRPAVDSLYGGGRNDQLAARGALGRRLQGLADRGAMHLVTGFKVRELRATPEGVVLVGEQADLEPVDEVIATTGFRPDLGLLAELRLGLDPAVESPTALAPLIDPNVHSCGTVRPHRVAELAHPEPDFYIVGMKSYGRAPTFLLSTGYEQVRSVVAALTGDHAAAATVAWVLPETGVCSVNRGPAPAATVDAPASACCGAGSPRADAAPVEETATPAPVGAGCGSGNAARAGEPLVLVAARPQPAPSCGG
jgi:thioredoxin reductase